MGVPRQSLCCQLFFELLHHVVLSIVSFELLGSLYMVAIFDFRSVTYIRLLRNQVFSLFFYNRSWVLKSVIK